MIQKKVKVSSIMLRKFRQNGKKTPCRQWLYRLPNSSLGMCQKVFSAEVKNLRG